MGGHSACSRKLDGSTLHQPTADAETTPSRSPGIGVVVQMRENADLAFICPVEASALVGGASPTGILSIDASGLGPRLLVRRMRSFLSFRLKPYGLRRIKRIRMAISYALSAAQ